MIILLPMVLSAALAAQPPSVAVLGPESGPGSLARANVEAALVEREDVVVVGLQEWKAAARRIGLRGRAATSVAAVRRVAASAGVSAALVLSPPVAKGDRRLRAVLVDAKGRELLRGTFWISGKGSLGKTRAALLAGDVAGLLQPRPEKPRPRPPPPPPAPAPEPLLLEPPPPPPPPREPVLRLAVGVPLAWRSASVKPQTGNGFSYNSGSPYAGVCLDFAVAPLRAAGATGWLSPFELEVEASHRFASAVIAGTSGGKLGAREQRLGLDAVYPVRIGGSTRLAARIGYGWHRFTIDPNPVMPDSIRHGLRLGVDARQQLLRALSVEALVRIFPAMRPGPAERAAYGADGSGWGYQLGGALQGPVLGVLGWRAAYDYLRFSDSFSGAGATGTGGNGNATYHTATGAATFTW